MTDNRPPQPEWAKGVNWWRLPRSVVRQASREALIEGFEVWSCSHDGPCPTSRSTWCDLGCGSDYNRMTKWTLEDEPEWA